MNPQTSGTDRAALRDLADLQSDAHYAIHRSHRAVADLHDRPAVREAALRAVDALLPDLYWAKWTLGSMNGSYADFAAKPTTVGPRHVADRFRTVTHEAERIARACRAGTTPAPVVPPRLSRAGTEIAFHDGVPLVPTVCPVVVLGGSSRDMGRQYAKQVIEIYGSWIFEQLAARTASASETDELTSWAAQLRRHMPEILDFARGWSEGAHECGTRLTESQALAIWTGYDPPAERYRHMGAGLGNDDEGVAAYLGSRTGEAALRELSDLCSGAAAWGAATVDGALVAGSTTDHDCTYQATIVAYPTEGNRFIYTPFSANGSIPVLGRFYMAGHPGMNDRGVAYVHHGGQQIDGGSAGGGPKDEWGHGVRRGASTVHALQFAASATEARDMMLALPVGDPGPILGTAGGFFADPHYGVAIEERAGSPTTPRPIAREATYDKQGIAHDFLYANNNPLSEDPGSWAAVREGHFRYSRTAGWHITRADESGSDDPATVAARMSTKNSAGRNRYLHQRLMEAYGRIDLTYMHDVYASSGQVPAGDDRALRERWARGEEWACSAAHRGNAFTSVVRPSAAGDGLYRACIGPADRFLQVREPSHGYYYHDETNAFWELVLTDEPRDLVAEAGKEADRRLREAEGLVASLTGSGPSEARLGGLLARAREEAATGRSALAGLPATVESCNDDSMAALARVVRCFTRSQVRAAQVAAELGRATPG